MNNGTLIPTGTTVVLVNSSHADLSPGMEGEIVEQFPEGYGLKITANFTKISPATNREERTVFVRKDAVKIKGGPVR